MKTYEATATREGRWWIVEVDDIGTTQGRNTSEAHDMAVDMVAAMLDVPADTVRVKMHFSLEDELEQEIRQARHATQAAAEAQERAAELSRKAVTDLKQAGMSGRDVATILGLSPQRVSQLSRG